MTVDEIRAAYYTKPFQPFVVRLSDGRKFRVAERKYLAISPSGNEISVGIKESFVFIKMSNIESLDFKKPKRQSRTA